MKTKDSVLIKEAIDLIKLTNSIEYARLRAKKNLEAAWSKVNF